jgi:hypothetical protein
VRSVAKRDLLLVFRPAAGSVGGKRRPDPLFEQRAQTFFARPGETEHGETLFAFKESLADGLSFGGVSEAGEFLGELLDFAVLDV